MDFRNLIPSTNIDDRRPTFEDPSRPSFNYRLPTPFRGAPSADVGRPAGLAAQAGSAGDFQQLQQMLLAQRALEMLQARGQLPSHAWYNQAPHASR